MTVFEGKLIAGKERFAIVVSRFNDLITRRLLDGAVDAFRRHGAEEAFVDVAWVPGAFEIPLAAIDSPHGEYVAVCCLGAVIQGQTTHHEYINHQVAEGIMRAGREYRIPVLFGLLTCTPWSRHVDHGSGGKAGNKGSECALAAVEMVNLLKQLPTAAG